MAISFLPVPGFLRADLPSIFRREFLGKVPNQDLVITGGGGGNESHSSPRSMRTIAMLVFVASESMLFLSLAAAFYFARFNYPEWPPVGQPRLSLGLAVLNSLLLLTSGWTMVQALASVRRGRLRRLQRELLQTFALGLAFLLLQGVEWLRAATFGLPFAGNLYGASFYVLVGGHGLHVLGAVIALGIVCRRALQGKYSRQRCDGLQACGIYWLFVVAVWPLLFAVLYVA